jgi:hypothetical protein
VIVRAVALCAALAAGLGGTAVAGRLESRLPAPATTAVAAPRLDLPAAAPTLVCPGPETAVVPAGGTPTPSPGPWTVTAAADGDGAEAVRIGPFDRVGGSRLSGEQVRVFSQAPEPAGPLRFVPAQAGAAAEPVRLAAVQATLARSGDLRGLVAGSCTPSAGDIWLLGGDTATGHRAKLLLTNPTPAPAVVDVRLSGPDGPLDLPTARGVVLAPGRIRALALDALAPGVGPLAVHVVARSGRVTALLHDTRLRGAVPQGTDDASPSAAPARHLVVPGVVVLPKGGATLRIAAVGADDAVVRYRFAGTAGAVAPPDAGIVTVPAGGVAEVPLPFLPPGAYAAVLDADTPVAAAARITVAGSAQGPLRTVSSDLAWSAATAPLTGDVAGAVPRPVDPGPGGAGTVRPPAAVRLVLTAAGPDAAVGLRQLDHLGRRLGVGTVHVPAGRAVVVPLGPATAAYVLGVPAGTPVHVALVETVDDPAGALLSAVAVQPAVVAARTAPPAVEDPLLTSR